MQGDAAVVTLDWPDRGNVVSPDDAVEVALAIEHAGATGAAAVVLTGAGAFCSGSDLRFFAELSANVPVDEIRSRVYEEIHSMIRALGSVPVPTIAAVDGPAVGLGLDLALACDVRFVGPEGWLRQGWAAMGLIHGTGGMAMLERLRPGLVWRLLATQERLDAQACERLGLAEFGAPSALAAGVGRATAFAALPRETLEAYVELGRSLRWPPESHFARSAAIQARLIGSERFRWLARAALTESGHWDDAEAR
jgi:enoyl-CoA hydratase/carnithine racemase